jgi:hypothetical protein
MKVFHCDHCRQLLFFENVRCLKCDHPLAYLPDLGVIGSLDPRGNDVWTSPLPRANGRMYRLCRNYTQENVCNWAIPADDPNPLCRSCRLTRVIPDLSREGHRTAWYKLEVAKRRLVYTLLALRLPLRSRIDDPIAGLAFEFLADPPDPSAPRVLTGHAEGLITLNVAEADDAERERIRQHFHEPYRTLLGHFRHESGHYYWDRLIRQSDRLEEFRAVFGNEQVDYEKALCMYHTDGPPTKWQDRFISAYSSVHSWEDWAETWAHYLHLVDTLETANACGVRLLPPRSEDPALRSIPNPVNDRQSFDDLLESWLPLTYMLNNLNRGLGLLDAYPFVLANPVVKKLRFLHETVWSNHPSELPQVQSNQARMPESVMK